MKDAPTAGDDVDALSSFLEAFGEPDGFEVRVAEKVGGGRQLIGRYALLDFDPWTFAEQFGGGAYVALVHDGGGRYQGSKTFNVSSVVKGTLRTATPANATPPASSSSSDKLLDVMVAMIGQQAQSQTAILTALIGRPQPQSGPSWDSVLKLIGDRQQTPLGEMFDVLERAKAFAESGGGGADAGEATSLISAITGILGALGKAEGAAPASPATPKRRVLVRSRKPDSATATAAAATPDTSETPPASPVPASAGEAAAVHDDHGAAPERGEPAEADDDGDDESVAPPETVARAICQMLIGAFLVGQGDIDPAEFAADLVETFDDASLTDFLAGVPDGYLVDAIMPHVPEQYRGMVITPESEWQIAEIESALRRAMLDADDQPETPAAADGVAEEGGGGDAG